MIVREVRRSAHKLINAKLLCQLHCVLNFMLVVFKHQELPFDYRVSSRKISWQR